MFKIDIGPVYVVIGTGYGVYLCMYWGSPVVTVSQSHFDDKYFRRHSRAVSLYSELHLSLDVLVKRDIPSGHPVRNCPYRDQPAPQLVGNLKLLFPVVWLPTSAMCGPYSGSTSAAKLVSVVGMPRLSTSQ